MKDRIYLDNNSTTSVDPEVIKAMCIDLEGPPANPSSIHFFGQRAKGLLADSRHIIASFLKVKHHEIIFTSGGTEAINMTIKGAIKADRGHIITTDLDHASMYNTILELQKEGYETTFIQPKLYGAPTAEQVEKEIRSNTKLIVLSAVNSETGIKCDIERIAEIAKEKNITFIVDGVALLGKEMFTIPSGVSAMCFSGHKIHAPKGIGFVYIDSDLKLHPILLGGPQEFERRAGTENLPGILGVAQAVKLLSKTLPQASDKMRMLRERLEIGLQNNLSILLNGKGPRICNTTNICFPGIDGEVLLMNLDLAKIAVSHGSACSAGALKPSRVLLNMGIDPQLAKSSIRFSLSRYTTQEEIDITISTITSIVAKLEKIV